MATGNKTYEVLGVPRLGESEIEQQTAATDILTVTGASGQTGDFLVLRNNSSTEKFYVTKDGNLAVAGTASITGASSLQGNVVMAGTASVTGASTLQGNAAVGGTLTVTGAASHASTSSFQGASIFGAGVKLSSIGTFTFPATNASTASIALSGLTSSDVVVISPQSSRVGQITVETVAANVLTLRCDANETGAIVHNYFLFAKA